MRRDGYQTSNLYGHLAGNDDFIQWKKTIQHSPCLFILKYTILHHTVQYARIRPQPTNCRELLHKIKSLLPKKNPNSDIIEIFMFFNPILGFRLWGIRIWKPFLEIRPSSDRISTDLGQIGSNWELAKCMQIFSIKVDSWVKRYGEYESD